MNLNEMSAIELVNKINECGEINDKFKNKLKRIIDIFNALDNCDELDSRLTSIVENFDVIVSRFKHIQASLLLTNSVNTCDFFSIENSNDFDLTFSCECSINPTEYNDDIVNIMRIVLEMPFNDKNTTNKPISWMNNDIINEDGVNEVLSKLVKADNMIECFLHA